MGQVDFGERTTRETRPHTAFGIGCKPGVAAADSGPFQPTEAFSIALAIRKQRLLQ